MIIKFKRNNASGSSLPTSVQAGEPIWCKDILYVGSVGTSLGGSTTEGAPVKVATHVTGTETTAFPTSTTLEGTITLSPSEAKRYLVVDGKEYKIQMPASDPYTSARTPASHNLNSHSDVSINSVAANNLLYYNGSNWVNGTFSTIFGGTPSITDHNQTVKGNGTAFGADDAVDIIPGSNISVTANTTNKTITIANTYSHPNSGVTANSYPGSAGTATPLSHSGTFVVPSFTVDAQGHLTAAGTTTYQLPASGNTDTKVKQTALSSGTTAYPILMSAQSSPTSATAYEAKYHTSAKIDGSGYISAAGFKVGSSTGFLKANGTVDTNTYLTSTDLGDLAGAMVYRGTTTTVSNNALGYSVGGSTSGYTPATGDVLVASSNVTIVPSTATSGTKTTLGGKNINTNGDTTIETGDMLIYNGTEWYVVSGEGQVEDKNETLAWGTQKTVAKVNGTDIHVTLPANPNTDTSVTSAANHYTPSTNSGSALTKSASGATAAWSIDVVTGLTISRDSKGHVTDLSVTSGKIPANPNTNQKVKSGSSTFGDNATVNITASTGLTTSVTTTSGSEKIEIQHDTPSGAAATSSGFYKIATDARGHVTGATSVTASDITGLVGTIPAAANDSALKLKGQYTGTSGSTDDSSGTTLFSANASSESTLTVTGSDGIKTYRGTASGTTNTITVKHTNSVTQDTTGGFKKLKYDSQGHITGYVNVTASDITGLVTIPTVNDAKLQLKVGTSGTAVDSGYTANTASAVSLIFNDTASGAKFAVDSSTKVISITEIDGGTF